MGDPRTLNRRSYLASIGGTGATLVVSGCAGLGGGSGTIVPGTAPGFAPFEFENDDGELVGFDIDLAEAAIDEAGYSPGDWATIDFEQLITSLNNEDVDLIAAAMTITDERAEQVAFSDPYYEAAQAVVVAEGGADPGSTDDLSGLTVGAQAGTTGEDEVQALIDEGVVDENDYNQYENYPLAIQDLENGNVDAVMVDLPAANDFADDRAVRVAFTIETGEQYGFAMRQDDDRLSDINDALAALKDDGTYDEIRTEWIG